LLSFGGLVMMFSWNTPYKFFAASMLFFVYSSATLMVYFRLKQEDALGSSAFADSYSQLAADIALLRDRLG
jgi:hypothetical protein